MYLSVPSAEIIENAIYVRARVFLAPSPNASVLLLGEAGIKLRKGTVLGGV